MKIDLEVLGKGLYTESDKLFLRTYDYKPFDYYHFPFYTLTKT